MGELLKFEDYEKRRKSQTPLEVDIVLGAGCALEMLGLNIELPDGLEHQIARNKVDSAFIDQLRTLNDFQSFVLQLEICKEIHNTRRFENADTTMANSPEKLLPLLMLDQAVYFRILFQLEATEFFQRCQFDNWSPTYWQYFSNYYLHERDLVDHQSVKLYIQNFVASEFAKCAPKVAQALNEDDNLASLLADRVVGFHPDRLR